MHPTGKRRVPRLLYLVVHLGEKGSGSSRGIFSSVIQLEEPLIQTASDRLGRRRPLQTELIHCLGQELDITVMEWSSGLLDHSSLADATTEMASSSTSVPSMALKDTTSWASGRGRRSAVIKHTGRGPAAGGWGACEHWAGAGSSPDPYRSASETRSTFLLGSKQAAEEERGRAIWASLSPWTMVTRSLRVLRLISPQWGQSTTEMRPLSKAPNPQLLAGCRSVGCSLLQVCVHLDGFIAENTFHCWLYSL